MSSAEVLGERTQPHTKDEESKFLGRGGGVQSAPWPT